MLITLPNRDSKWRKYSLVEIIWIYIIRELRSIGFSRKKILKLKDCIFPTLPNSDITDTRRFKQYVLSVVAKRDVYLIVKSDGEGDLAIDIELIETERKNPEFPNTYTMISINKLCAEFTGNKDYIKKNQFLYIPLKKELEFLNEVKNNEPLKK
jgi:DNA-binding transcriptional MerR regulator